MTVKIYTTKVCPYCQMAKQFLRQNKIEFEEIDVSENEEAANEMIEKSGQTGVPVLDINGKIIVGFNVKAIKEALNLK
jgi:glutaredoxin-like YruB-family protein